MEVVNTSDPSSLTVTTPSGATLKVGGQAVVLADLHTLVQQEAGNGA
jgi:hypothetical protein